MTTHATLLDTLDEEAIAWLSSCGVVHHANAIRAIQPSRLAAYAFPRTTTGQRLRLCTDLITWLFVFDDTFADGMFRRDPAGLAAWHATFSGVLAGRPSTKPTDPWLRSLASLLSRLDTVAPPVWTQRLCVSIARYFQGCERECTFRARQVWPTLDEYLAYRDGSIGVYPMLDLIELSTETYLTASPMLESCRRVSTLALALTNDIHSSRKERDEPDSFNAVAVLERQHKVSRAEALRMAQDLHLSLKSTYRRNAAVLLGGSSHDRLPLHSYCRGIEEWFEGNVRWSRECPRYNARHLGNDAEVAYAAA